MSWLATSWPKFCCMYWWEALKADWLNWRPICAAGSLKKVLMFAVCVRGPWWLAFMYAWDWNCWAFVAVPNGSCLGNSWGLAYGLYMARENKFARISKLAVYQGGTKQAITRDPAGRDS
ncbi:hypothetical protein KL910_002854 [Ogataea haglerorum]|uniref:Uncharacterized protein n=1 Tax=Ogataea haglerorum TaxID=1937702 RepID=A0ABQ7RH90_9ASCO|nr:hypothetical protein KL913_002120 [Ogataea haglerorum]KAG7765495.1 hypothetical protein KL946_002552 [Ogataea haglerorum]KAG7789156.1 hypothetical protein KL910_002854 [Ogataea haglerorum]KAG7790389.1 hypothetical protein KL945_001270 [Ogataea haglerorum]